MFLQSFGLLTVSQTFAKGDLPQEHRVLKGDSMMTMDHKPDRYVINSCIHALSGD